MIYRNCIIGQFVIWISMEVLILLHMITMETSKYFMVVDEVHLTDPRMYLVIMVYAILIGNQDSNPHLCSRLV